MWNDNRCCVLWQGWHEPAKEHRRRRCSEKLRADESRRINRADAREGVAETSEIAS
jgi:hypothetical protein